MRLIAKERLSGPRSPIINVELEFEGSGRALHYFSTLIWGEKGGNWEFLLLIVEHFFISVAIFTQVASAPLIYQGGIPIERNPL